MDTAVRRKKARKPKKASGKKHSPQTARQRALTRGIRKLFGDLGFHRIKTDGKQIQFNGRSGELDDIFVYDNTVIIAEYTTESGTEHLLKKKPLYDLILDDPIAFLKYAASQYPSFLTHIQGLAAHGFLEEHFRIRIVYAPSSAPSVELTNVCPRFHFLYGATIKYFQALASTIECSGRNEFFKFLGLEFEEIGEAIFKGGSDVPAYQGYLLPEGNSSYPKGFKIVSFYADPENLIAKSYVLRRDGWRDDDHLYQRILIGKKIRAMRRYLATENRVFVNNVIVTLPDGTKLNDINDKNSNLEADKLGKVRPVTVMIAPGFDTIGVVDGQHRIFCYHEGRDKEEASIKALRKRQNLLVTGIIYPQGYSDHQRRIFEARLFLEINDNQARARSALKQDIEVIIRPTSTIAIAKRVMQRLGKHGPYRDRLQTNYFDPPTKIKTSSIVSYGLRPIVKLDGEDSLFHAWQNPHKEKLKEGGVDVAVELIDKYVEYCAEKLSEFMLEVKLKMSQASWDLDAKPRSPLLSTTAINGMIVCMRRIISAGLPLTAESHKTRLKNVTDLDFSSFKSSQWQRLGTELFEKHYR